MEEAQLCPRQGQGKSQCPEFLLHFKVQSFGAHRQLLSSLSHYPGSLACSWLLSISGPLLEPARVAYMAMGMRLLEPHGWVLLGERAQECTGAVHHQVGKTARETGSLLEAMGHVL